MSTATKFSVVGLLAATCAQAATFGGFAGMGDFKNFGPSLGNIGQDVDRKLSGFGGFGGFSNNDTGAKSANYAGPSFGQQSYGGYGGGPS